MPKEIKVKSILNKTARVDSQGNKKRDEWFLDDYTINLYSSCAFNCLYCYIRGSKYGHNLAESISVKTNAIELLDRQLFNRAKKEEYGFIVLSSATDPYLKLDDNYQLTRQALELILKYKFPVHIITKSNRVERDFDLIHQIENVAILPNDLPANLPGSILTFSFSTLDEGVGKIFEPGAPSPQLRLGALNNAIKENFLAGVSLMPLIPFVSDTTASLRNLFSTFSEINARYVMPATITLFGNEKGDSKTLMLKAIRKHYPELEDKYLKFFANGSEMPLYYQKAFDAKMKELGKEYGLPDRILKGID